MLTGIVKWYNAEKGFGFIVPDRAGSDVFFHVSALDASVQNVEEGDHVSYEMGVNKGRTCAVNVNTVIAD